MECSRDYIVEAKRRTTISISEELGRLHGRGLPFETQ